MKIKGTLKSKLEAIEREYLDLITKQIGCPFKEFESLHLEIMAKQIERRKLQSTGASLPAKIAET